MTGLIEYLKSTGKISQVQPVILAKARSMYVNRGKSVRKIAKELGVPPSTVQRWIVAFDWEEERERKVFTQFRKLSKFRKNNKSLDERHDRIAGAVESIVEQMLNDHFNGRAELSTKDLGLLTRILKDTQAIRRTAAGISEKKETKVSVSLETPESIQAAQEAILDMLGVSPRKTKVEKVASEESKLLPATDAEFEVTDGGTPGEF